MPFAPAAVIDGPDRSPLPYGVFSVASLAEAATERWENGVQWEAFGCDPVSVVVGDCDPEIAEGFPKEFPDGGPGVGEASAFTVYGAAKCSPTGGEIDKQNRLAEETLLAREEQAVELRLWAALAADDAAVLLTSAEPLIALAKAEKWIGDNYGSKGVIHASRFAATILVKTAVLRPVGGQMQTQLGTPVVVGSGYPGTGIDSAAPTAGNEFIAASPALFGYRSQVFVGSNQSGDLLDVRRNDLYGIAERNYLLGYDPCGVAFVELNLGA